MNKKIIIIGGVAGGASAAARLRRLDEHADIIMFERGEHISFANCGLPYYIGETIKDRAKLLVQTPEAMFKRFQIDVRVQSDVIGIDPIRKIVTVHSKDRGTYTESYDHVILSPGAKPLRPAIPGIDHQAIYTLRNIPDADRIKEKIDVQQASSAIVIGGGYIGVEMAENLVERGMHVTLIEAAPHILAPFDSDISVAIEQHMQEHGVALMLGDGVKSFEDDHDGVKVQLQSGRTFRADIVILAIGVAPDTRFIQESGIALGARGHIVVNEYMQTNFPDIYAVGDAVETTDFITGQKTAIPLAGPANKQGRIAADHINGIASSYKGTQGTSILKIFDTTAASTGHNERTLQRMNIDYHVVVVHPNSHAGYYPGATAITLKLLFDHAGKVLGAQAIGTDGVDKRIDVIATVIRLSGTIYDLTELELSYAPPYSSAKDPVNMAGYLAENVLEGHLEVYTVQDIAKIEGTSSICLDVRTQKEYDQGHIPHAVHIPVDELRNRLAELDASKDIYAYCEVGMRGYIASRILKQHGFRVKNLTGGYRSYKMSLFTPHIEVEAASPAK
jgi:CoA-disulfide reductase